MSGEHILSAGLFSDPVVAVAGIAPLEGVSHVPVVTLKAKILCTNHNNALSDIDSEMIRLYEALREHTQFSKPTESAVKLDGWKIERWCMKVAIGLLAAKWIAPRDAQIGPELVEIAFGRKRLPELYGLYVVRKVPISVNSDADHLSWSMFTLDGDRVSGFYFQLFGLGLLLSTTDKDPTPNLRGIQGTESDLDWSVVELTYRPQISYVTGRRDRWKENEESRLRIELTWD